MNYFILQEYAQKNKLDYNELCAVVSKAAEAPTVPSGVLQVQEADCVIHVHPEYGTGLFFTEDAILAATPKADSTEPN